MGRANRALKDRGLRAIGAALLERKAQILAANAKDVEAGRANGTSAALLDRLTLNDARIEALAGALENLAGLPDPVGNVVRGQTLPNGLRLRQVNVPMGVVAAIYEARPNVTVDIAGLALKSGNAVILRGGTAAAATNEALIQVLREALESVGLPADAVQTVDQYGREGANVLMRARGRVDVLIPRGGRDLIQTVVNNSSVPVIETGEGNVHIFIDESASEDMAVEILLNAKTQRPSVCNTVETLLVHSGSTVLPAVAAALSKAGVRLHADDRIRAALPASVESVPRHGRGLGHGVHGPGPRRRHGGQPGRGREAHPHLVHRPHRGDPDQRPRATPSASSRKSTPRQSSSTRPRALPTAANWAWVPKSAFPRRSCMPAARWA